MQMEYREILLRLHPVVFRGKTDEEFHGLKIEFIGHRQVIDDMFEPFYLVKCKSDTSGEEN